MLHTSTVPEPFGLVVLEGLALGKAVVASRLGAPSEIVQPGDGLLFDPARPEDLAMILRDLANDPARRQSLGKSAATRAQMFDVRRTAKSVTRLWARMVQEL